MQAGAIARFGGITAYGDEFHGLGFHFTDLIGYTDAPDVDRERVRRPAGHGSFRLPAYLEERIVRIPGFMVARSHIELEHESARFRGLITQRVQLTVEDTKESTWVSGLVTRASFTNHGFAPEGTWELEVTCEDPRKFGTVREFAAGSPAIHYGNWPATPRLLIGAGSGGYTVTGPNGRTVVVATAPAAAHYIDFETGGLYTAAGVRQVGGITTYRDWEIPAGPSGVIATISGARNLKQRVLDTYV